MPTNSKITNITIGGRRSYRSKGLMECVLNQNQNYMNSTPNSSDKDDSTPPSETTETSNVSPFSREINDSNKSDRLSKEQNCKKSTGNSLDEDDSTPRVINETSKTSNGSPFSREIDHANTSDLTPPKYVSLDDSSLSIPPYEETQTATGHSKTPTGHSKTPIKGKKEQQSYPDLSHRLLLIIGGVALFFAFCYSIWEWDASADAATSFEEQQFPNQEENFALSIRVAVDEIKKFNQPKSIIFLHTQDKPMEDILQKISSYASSKILSSSTEPIIMDEKGLSRKDFVEDYGTLITEIKLKLSDSAIVIIRNIDKVSGTVAQAFHSLCDEYNPVKPNVLFLFTIKVNKLPKDRDDFVEKTLKKHWHELHSDKFYPLYTRISTFILKVS